MEIVLLILAIFILDKTTKQFERIEIKFIAGSIFSISYFFIWPFVHYYVQLLAWPEFYIQISFITLVAVSMLLIRAFVKVKFYKVILLMSVGLFLTFWAITSNYDIQIKDKIAEYTNYFGKPLDSNFEKTDMLAKLINSPTKAYSAFIPAYWKKYKHTDTHLPFYRPTNMDSSIVEFRPRCYDKQNLSISEIVEGMSNIQQDNATSKHQCFHWNVNDYACRIDITDDSGITRVRWIGVNKKTNRVLELDFLTQNGSKQDLMLIDSIFKSIKFNEPAKNTTRCVYSIEWF